MASCFEWFCESCLAEHSFPITKGPLQGTAILCDKTLSYNTDLLCDEATGDPIITITAINCDLDEPVVSFFNIDGTEFTGTAVACGNKDHELLSGVCDEDTGEIVIVILGFNPQTGNYDTRYFLLDGTVHDGQNLVVCARDWEYTTPFTYCLNDVEDVSRTDIFENGGTTPIASVWQSSLGAVIPAPDPADITVGSCQEDQIFVTIGHILDCGFEDATVEINEEVTFADAGTFSRLEGSESTISKLREIIFEAQEVEKNEIRNGVVVTPIVFNTTTNGVVSFNPSGYTNGNTTTIFIEDAELVSAWPVGIDTLESVEYTRLIDCNCVPVEMVQRINNDGTGELISILDPAQSTDAAGIKAIIPLPLGLSVAGPFPGQCVTEDPNDLYLSTGYIQSCTPQDVQLFINQNANFSFNAGPNTFVITANASTISLLVDAIDAAQVNQQSEENSGLPVTVFTITATDGDVYTFNPNELVSSTSTSLTLANIVVWPNDGDKVIESFSYTALGNCTCESIEMVQRLAEDGTSELIAILDPSTTDIVTGQKTVVDYPFEYGVTGPFPGPCPEPIQVIDIADLCCNSNLVGNEPEIAQTRLAWLDGSDISLMTPDGGALGTAVDGDNIVQVDDKLGGTISFVLPANVATGDDGNANGPAEGPILIENEINGLSVLHFDTTNPNRLRLDTGSAQGSSFTLFYLYRAENANVANQAIVSVGPNNSDGDAYHPLQGSWQLARDSSEPWFIFRIASDNADGEPVDIFAKHSPTSDGTVASNTFEQSIAPLAEAYDGQAHLVTMTFDSVEEEIQIYFDGELRYHGDMSPAPNTFGSLAADYFRIFGNRAGDAYGTGDVAEMFYADSIIEPEDVGIVNAYLVCKWDIDPSLAAGGTGNLELAPDGTYNTATDFVRLRLATGDIVYRNVASGLEYSTVPLPGLAVCIPAGTDAITTNDTEHSEHLCDVNASGDVVGIAWHSITYNSLSNVISSRMVGYYLTSPDTLQDPYTPIGTLQVCSEQVTIDSRDIESKILCDDNGSFIRHTVYDVTSGLVDNVYDTELDNTTAYVIVGNITDCDNDVNIPDREIICYRTTATGDTILQAWARHDDSLVGVIANHIDPVGGIAYFTSTAPVTPLNINQVGFEFVLCELDTIDNEPIVLCDTNGQFLRHFNYTNGVVTNVTDTELDGTTAYVVAGTVELCNENDPEQQIFCDDIGPFIRHYIYTDGVVTNTVDTELDGATAYVVTGTVEVCIPETLNSEAFIENLDTAQTWTPPMNLETLTIMVRRVGDVADTPTVTDSVGVWDIFENDSLMWSVNENGLLTFTSLQVKANDYITLLYTVRL